MQTENQITIALPLGDAQDIARQLAIAANQYLSLAKHFHANVQVAYLAEANKCRMLAMGIEAAIATRS